MSKIVLRRAEWDFLRGSITPSINGWQGPPLRRDEPAVVELPPGWHCVQCRLGWATSPLVYVLLVDKEVLQVTVAAPVGLLSWLVQSERAIEVSVWALERAPDMPVEWALVRAVRRLLDLAALCALLAAAVLLLLGVALGLAFLLWFVIVPALGLLERRLIRAMRRERLEARTLA